MTIHENSMRTIFSLTPQKNCISRFKFYFWTRNILNLLRFRFQVWTPYTQTKNILFFENVSRWKSIQYAEVSLHSTETSSASTVLWQHSIGLSSKRRNHFELIQRGKRDGQQHLCIPSVRPKIVMLLCLLWGNLFGRGFGFGSIKLWMILIWKVQRLWCDTVMKKKICHNGININNIKW